MLEVSYLSKSDPISILEISQNLRQVQTLAELEVCIRDIQELLGFTSYSFSLAEIDQNKGVISLEQSSNFRQDWLERYIGSQLWHVDPIHQIRFCVPAIGEPISWKSVYERQTEKAQKDFINEAREFNLEDNGLVTGIKTPGLPEYSIFTIEGNDLQIDLREGWIMQYFAKEIHESMATIKSVSNQGQYKAGELDVLRYVKQGLKNQQIAELLGIDVSTVKKRLAQIYEKTDTFGRTDTIAKLIEQRAMPDDLGWC